MTAPRLELGDVRVTSILDGALAIPAPLFFPSTSEEDWLPHREFLTPDGVLSLPMGGFLVESGDRRVLVDAGFGEPVSSPDFGRLLDNLRAAGVGPEDVTDVVFTHLHFDHVGWATDAAGDVVFENATYRCHAHDLEFFFGPDVDDAQSGKQWGAAKTPAERLAPVRERIEPFEGEGTVAPGIDVVSAPGHTPGSAVLVLSSGAERCVLLGDVVHCPVELLDDQWQILGDVDADLAKRTREVWAREVESTQAVVGAAHFPGMRFGRLLPGEQNRTFTTLG